jgi:hypothetical protein
VKAILQYTAVGIHNDLGLEYDPLRKGAGALTPRRDRLRTVGEHVGAVGAPWLTASPFPWTSIGGETLTWNQGGSGQRRHLGSTATFKRNRLGQRRHLGQQCHVGQCRHLGSNLVWTDSQSWATR